MSDSNKLEIEIVKLRKDVDSIEKYMGNLNSTLEKLSDISDKLATVIIKQDMQTTTARANDKDVKTNISTLNRRVRTLEAWRNWSLGASAVCIAIISLYFQFSS